MTEPKSSTTLKRIATTLKWSVIIDFLTLVTLPMISSWFIDKPTTPAWITRTFMQLQEYWLWGFVGFATIWIVFLGGCFASFLNVVAWRIPRGKTLLGKSQCPFCGTGLSMRENMPVIGWLEQGGESKCCGLPIDARYLYVELFLGFVFLLIVTLGIVLQQPNSIEWRTPTPPLLRAIGILNWSAGVQILGQLILICLLFTGSLFRWQADSIPKSVIVFGIFVGLVMVFLQGLAVMELEPSSSGSVSWKDWSWKLQESLFHSLQRGMLAIVLGLLVANFEKLLFHATVFGGHREILFCLICTGLILGVPVSLAIAGWFVLLSLLLRAAGQFGEGTGWMAPSHRWFAATLLHLSFWRFYAQWLEHPLTFPWPVSG